MPYIDKLPKQPNEYVRLKELEIRDFKAIDYVKFDFPLPNFEDDLDVIVFGSANGVGKTSILEAISLLRICTFLTKDKIDRENLLQDLELTSFIRAGKKKFEIKGLFTINGKDKVLEFTYHIENGLSVEKDGQDIWQTFDKKNKITYGMVASFKAKVSEPLIFAPLLFFHSDRKINSERPDLEIVSKIDGHAGLALVRGNKVIQGFNPYSEFKVALVRDLLNISDRVVATKAVNTEEIKEKLRFLDNLIRNFIGEGFKLEKFTYMDDGTIDLLVTNPFGEYFSFDGLSSGQKEILETLYLIWENRIYSNIVLIDEPELHLNTQWHSEFIANLKKFCPYNQYIISTHSRAIAESVEKDRRRFLERE